MATIKRKKVRSIKVKTIYPLLILRSIERKTDALDEGSRGIVTTTVLRRLKELHKRHTFYPIMMMKC